MWLYLYDAGFGPCKIAAETSESASSFIEIAELKTTTLIGDGAHSYTSVRVGYVAAVARARIAEASIAEASITTMASVSMDGDLASVVELSDVESSAIPIGRAALAVGVAGAVQIAGIRDVATAVR